MIRRGFTVVELAITIAIMGILLTLAVVTLTATQVNGRDSERKADAEAIAASLEAFYTVKDSGVAQSGNAYPGTVRLSASQISTTLPNIAATSLRAPGVGTGDPISIVPATNAIQTTSGVLPQPTPTTYVYQPMTSNGSLCVNPTASEYALGECRKFSLYYLEESTGTVQVIASKHQ